MGQPPLSGYSTVTPSDLRNDRRAGDGAGVDRGHRRLAGGVPGAGAAGCGAASSRRRLGATREATYPMPGMLLPGLLDAVLTDLTAE